MAPRTPPVSWDFAIEVSVDAALHGAGLCMPYAVALLKTFGAECQRTSHISSFRAVVLRPRRPSST
ncbi:MAG TPA: hypothetical protein VGF11_04200, partial [Acidimicrobiales bacterium]